jgi:hypothetical protein
MTGDGLLELRRRTTLVRGISPRGARHWGAALRDQTSHEGSWCQASMHLSPHWSPGQPSRSFLTQINCSPMWALWSCGRRTSVVQAQRQIHRVAGPVHRRWPENAFSDRDCGTTVTVIVPLRCDPWLEPILSTAALMPAEPHIRSPLRERLAPQSLIRKVIGLGRAGPHCMSAYHSHCL